MSMEFLWSPKGVGRPSTRGFCAAAVAAAFGFLFVPAIVAILWSLLVAIEAVRRKRWVWFCVALLVGMVAVSSCLLGVWAIDVAQDEATSWRAAIMARGLDAYYRHEGRLPDDFADISVNGPLTPEVCEWDAILYCPVRHWDGKTAVTVVLLASRSWGIAYLQLGDTSVHRVTYEDLADLLAKDDGVRKGMGEERLWANVDWQKLKWDN
jgi:hypothetical protein